MYIFRPAFNALQTKDLAKLQEAWQGKSMDDVVVGTTPLLHVACGFGDVKAVRWILNQGANPSLVSSHQTPLAIVASVHREETLELLTVLLDAGATLQDQKIHDLPLLHYACGSAARFQDLSVLNFLYSKGLELNTLDSKGNNALHLVIKEGSWPTQLGTWLLERGVDLHHRNIEGWTPTMTCFRFGSPELLHYLLEKGGETHEFIDGEDFFKSPIHGFRNQAVYDAFVSKQILEKDVPPSSSPCKPVRL